MKNVGNSSDGRSQGVPKISGHLCIGRIWGHCAFIFAIAQLSCLGLFRSVFAAFFCAFSLCAGHFYRPMHFSAYARSWDRMSSVRLSVCPSVCNVGGL